MYQINQAVLHCTSNLESGVIIVTGLAGSGKTGFLQILSGALMFHPKVISGSEFSKGILMIEGDAFGSTVNDKWTIDIKMLMNALRAARMQKFACVVGFIADNMPDVVHAICTEFGKTPTVVIKRSYPWFRSVYKSRMLIEHNDWFERFINDSAYGNARVNEYYSSFSKVDQAVTPVFILDLGSYRFPSENGRGSWFTPLYLFDDNEILDIKCKASPLSRVDQRVFYGALTLIVPHVLNGGRLKITEHTFRGRRMLYASYEPIKVSQGWKTDPQNPIVKFLPDVARASVMTKIPPLGLLRPVIAERLLSQLSLSNHEILRGHGKTSSETHVRKP